VNSKNEKCPRCGDVLRAFPSDRGALSRVDDRTIICGRCGSEELWPRGIYRPRFLVLDSIEARAVLGWSMGLIVNAPRYSVVLTDARTQDVHDAAGRLLFAIRRGPAKLDQRNWPHVRIRVSEIRQLAIVTLETRIDAQSPRGRLRAPNEKLLMKWMAADVERVLIERAAA
jgi:ribosomal protein S27AE